MNISLGECQLRFAEMIWDNEPVKSGDLVKMAETKFHWKKSTTYTVLRVLCEKGIMQNISGTVSSLISKDQFHMSQCVDVLDETYEGSLPAFVAAFAQTKKISRDEAATIKEMIDKFLNE